MRVQGCFDGAQFILVISSFCLCRHDVFPWLLRGGQIGALSVVR